MCGLPANVTVPASYHAACVPILDMMHATRTGIWLTATTVPPLFP